MKAKYVVGTCADIESTQDCPRLIVLSNAGASFFTMTYAEAKKMNAVAKRCRIFKLVEVKQKKKKKIIRGGFLK